MVEEETLPPEDVTASDVTMTYSDATFDSTTGMADFKVQFMRAYDTGDSEDYMLIDGEEVGGGWAWDHYRMDVSTIIHQEELIINFWMTLFEGELTCGKYDNDVWILKMKLLPENITLTFSRNSIF